MATTIIDRLVVELGLDPKQFTKGTKQAATDTKTMQDQVSYSAGEMVAAIHRVAAEFVGLFLTIRGVSDLVGQFAGLNENVRQLGIESRNLGESAADLRDWGNVSELAGGKADDAAQSIQGLEKSIFNVKQGFGWDDQLTNFLRLNVDTGVATGKMRDFHAILLDTAKALQGQSSADKFQWVQKLGLQGGIANAVTLGPAEVERLYGKVKAIPQVNGGDVAAAQRLAEAFALLRQRVVALATKILTAVEPAIEGLFNAFSKFLSKNQGKVTNGIDTIAAWATGGGPERLIVALTGFAQVVVEVFGFVYAFLHPADTMEKIGGGLVDLAKSKMQAGSRESQVSQEIAAAEKAHRLPAGLLEKTGNGPSKLGLGSANALAAILADQHAALGGDKADPDWTKTVAAINARVKATAAPATNTQALQATQGAGASPKARAKVTHAASGVPTAAAAKGATKSAVGDIFVQTQAQAKDVPGIAGRIGGALQRKLTVSQADGALA